MYWPFDVTDEIGGQNCGEAALDGHDVLLRQTSFAEAVEVAGSVLGAGDGGQWLMFGQAEARVHLHHLGGRFLSLLDPVEMSEGRSPHQIRQREIEFWEGQVRLEDFDSPKAAQNAP